MIMKAKSPHNIHFYSREGSAPNVQCGKLRRQANLFSVGSMARELLDAIPDIVFVLNGEHQIVVANHAVYELLDLTSENDLIGRKPGEVMSCLSAIQAESGCGTGAACRTCGALTAILDSQKGEKSVQDCLLRRQIGDEMTNLTLRMVAVPLVRLGERFTVLTGTDISHERRRQALEKIFFHDIMNLVGCVDGFAKLMLENEGEGTGRLSKKISQASQRIIEEVDAQRMLLAAEKGDLQAAQQLVDSHQVLKAVKGLFEDLAENRTLVFAPSLSPSVLVSDRIIIGRILGNMVKNALEASTSEQVISLGDGQVDDQVVFWVHNSAEIPEIYHPRIFQRDFSTKGIGRGLGTYSMKILATLINGKVCFSSSAEHGTIFQLLVQKN